MTRLLTISNLLRGVRVINGRDLARTPVTSVEREVREGTMGQETRFVSWHTVADLGVHLRCRALERRNVVQLRGRYRVPNPVQELLA
jgi:hypothetical protein